MFRCSKHVSTPPLTVRLGFMTWKSDLYIFSPVKKHNTEMTSTWRASICATAVLVLCHVLVSLVQIFPLSVYCAPPWSAWVIYPNQTWAEPQPCENFIYPTAVLLIIQWLITEQTAQMSLTPLSSIRPAKELRLSRVHLELHMFNNSAI